MWFYIVCQTHLSEKKFNIDMSSVMRKPAFCICENKDADQLSFVVTAKLISAFVFATRIVQPLYFLYTKPQASRHLVWLYSLVCVGPGWKPQRPVFSQRGSYHIQTTIFHFLDVLIIELFTKNPDPSLKL